MATVFVPKGKDIQILVGGRDVLFQDNIAQGLRLTLDEDLNIQLSSNFEPLYSGGGNLGADLLGQISKDVGFTGFSSQFKQFGFQVWKNTQPVTLNLNLRFYMGKTNAFSGRTEVVNPMRAIMNLNLPSEGGAAGSLITPGPSVLDLFGGGSEASKGRTISLSVGNVIRFPKVIVRSVQPTFSSNVDTEGYPIEGKLAVEIQTLFNATTELFPLLPGAGPENIGELL